MLNNFIVSIAIAFICCSCLVNSYAISTRKNRNNDYSTFEPGHCSSEIYCRGDLLHTVQMAKLYNDSKTFVDMKLKESPQTTLDAFRDFMGEHDDKPSKDEIRQFVNDYFEKPGAEFVDWVPQDWKESPAFLEGIKDPDYRQWASDLNAFWKQLGRQMTEDVAAIEGVLWNEEAGVWFDYDLINQKPRPYFVPTNLSPLWTGAFNQAEKELLSKKIHNYINQTGVDLFPGGVPNTLTQSGEQWDYPNVWPPMQYLLVEGLRALDTQESCKMAFEWASRWVRSNFIAYKQTRAMFEKYSAEELGGYGGGGEYEIQLGFAWSNGVVMQFLAQYGGDLKSTEVSKPATSVAFKLNRWTVGATTAVAIVATIATHVFGSD